MIHPRCMLIVAIVAVATTTTPLQAVPPIPAAPQNHPVALIGGTVHPLNAEPIPGGTLLFKKGRIAAIGKNVEIPADARKFDVRGKHVYPALIDAYTQMGLVEIGAVRATRDYSETGKFNPNVRAEVAVNPDSEMIPVTRSNGVALVLSAPRGGTISGMSALLQLDGWTYEDLTLKAPVGMHVNWPRMAPITAWWMDESPEEQLKERDEALRKLEEFFDQARAYQKSLKAAGNGGPDADNDTRLEAMLPVLDGKLPLIVQADEIRQIQAAVAFGVRQKVRLIILGGYDAARCAELLKEHQVPVILSAVHRLPQERHDGYDEAFTLPKRLAEAGVRYCISGGGGASNIRNLPYHAATAAAHGLSQEEALKAITLYPAEILGVDDRVGSLEVGKHATLIVTSGNPLDIRSQVEMEFIGGREIDLTDKHKQLYQKYREKYRRLQERAAVAAE